MAQWQRLFEVLNASNLAHHVQKMCIWLLAGEVLDNFEPVQQARANS